MILAIFETRNFVFHALGRDKAEAEKALREGWARHCSEYGAEPSYLDEFSDDIAFIPIEVGTCLRDGEAV